MKEIFTYNYPLQEYLRNNGYIWLSQNYKWIIESGLLLFIITYCSKYIKKIIQYLLNRKISKDLHPYYTLNEVNQATRNYVQTKFQNVSPSKADEPVRSKSIAKQKLFLKNLLGDNQDDERFYAILADSGMGKTTFSINLYIKYKTKISIKRKHNIALIPLGYSDSFDQINKIEDKNTILILDGFDEDSLAYSDYKNRLNELINITKEFRTVILTCRTQFFPTEEEEPKETGIIRFGVNKGTFEFQKMYISPFDKKDINLYLLKKYNFLKITKKKKAKKIINKVPNLMFRPMLLNYIDDLIATDKQYTYSYQIYDILITKWVEREASRVPADIRRKYKYDLMLFSESVADLLYKKFENNEELNCSNDEISSIAAQHAINIIELELKTKSLLNRNARGQYKFAHKSIFEYFVAKKLFLSRGKKQDITQNSLSVYLAYKIEAIVQKKGFFSLIKDELRIINNTSKQLSKYCFGLSIKGDQKRYQVVNECLSLIEQLEYDTQYEIKGTYIEIFLHNFSTEIFNLLSNATEIQDYDDLYKLSAEYSYNLLSDCHEFLIYGSTASVSLSTCKFFLKEMYISTENNQLIPPAASKRKTVDWIKKIIPSVKQKK